MGSTRSHSPVPGERKSGIPEGTEMPAPVSATTARAPAISAARRSRSAAASPPWTPALTERPSLPLERRRAFGEEGRDPLPGVRALKDGREPLLLGLDALLDVAGAGHALDLRERQRSLPRELARPRER